MIDLDDLDPEQRRRVDLQILKSAILTILSSHGMFNPIPESNLPGYLRKSTNYAAAMEELESRVWVVRSPNDIITLTPDGFNEYARHVGLVMTDQLTETLNTINKIAAADRQRVDGLQRAHDDHRAALDARLTDLDRRMERQTRDFYVQVLPLFALAVTAFALVITGAQTVKAPPETVTSPGAFMNAMATAAAPLIPLALLYLVLVGGTILAIGWRRGR